MDEITLPDSQYSLQPENTNIASPVKGSRKITALKEGKTRILLRDKNVADPALKLPGATLYVANPDYLNINVLPHKNLAILVGDHHDVQIEVYSK